MGNIIEIPAGVHHGLPSQNYHQRQLGVVSKSALDLINRSPAHYRAWVDGALEDEESPALTFGRAFHCALLEPEVFATDYVVAPDFGDCRRTDNRLRRNEWREEHASKEILSDEDATTIARMRDSVLRHPLARQMIREGESELTLSWVDSETGLKCKSRLDYYVRDLAMIVDLKSTDDASWSQFRRAVASYGYHRQDALYRAAALALDLPVQHFVLAAVEKKPPYAIATYTLDSESIAKGYSSVRRDMATMADCLKSDSWPGYPETILELEVPPWAT